MHAIKNKIVLVTGGSRGIGSDIVKLLAKEGYHVIFTYNTDIKSAIKINEELELDGAKSSYFKCDISDSSQIKKLCDTVLDNYGVPYAIIYNAGISIDNLHINTTELEWNKIINTNLNSIYHFNNCLLKEMLQLDDSCIVAISSITSLKGNIGQVAYGASKAAINGMVKSLAKEVGRFNIRVNCIAPGFIETEMLDTIPPLAFKNIKKGIPLNRIGQVSDISSLVSFLISKSGKYITGQTIIVDGGLSC